jgi:hypothetical protein
MKGSYRFVVTCDLIVNWSLEILIRVNYVSVNKRPWNKAFSRNKGGLLISKCFVFCIPSISLSKMLHEFLCSEMWLKNNTLECSPLALSRLPISHHVSFTGEFSPNTDLENMIWTHTKALWWKKMTQIRKILKIFFFFFKSTDFLW